MKRCGWFENAKGFIFGRPLKYNTDFIGLTMDDAVLDVLNDLNAPIIINTVNMETYVICIMLSFFM